jgi:Pvc16 N-terminal domain
MLHDLDKTIEKLILERGNLSKNEIDIAFELPSSEWASRLGRPTINCWCYDLRENVKLRNMEMQLTRNNRIGEIRQAPLRFMLTYLITAWARKVEDEHQLLWRALGALAGTMVLEPELCEGTMREQPYDIPVAVGQMGDTTGNMVDLWSVLESEMRLGFPVVFTVALDVERGFDAPLVFEKRIGVGQSDNPPDQVMTALDRYIIQKAQKPDQEE